ncbi:TPA: insecticidal delta-endotoxin, partial [Bacillus toyonensis]
KKRQATINTNGNNPQYPWMFFPYIRRYDYKDVEDWNLFNAYRRTMTLLVLDWLAIWPTFDFKLYPIHMGLKTALTREIYTNIVGYHTLKYVVFPWQLVSITKEQIEKEFVRPPHLFTWLDNINVRKLNEIDNDNISGIILKTSYTLDPKHSISTSLGATENTSPSCSITNFPITKVNTLFNGRDRINFLQFESINNTVTSCGYYKDTPPYTCGAECEPRPGYPFAFSVPDFQSISPSMASLSKQIPLHHLSWMYVGKSGNFYDEELPDRIIDAVGCAWTHPSVDRKNMLASDGITQIPAVMSH